MRQWRNTQNCIIQCHRMILRAQLPGVNRRTHEMGCMQLDILNCNSVVKHSSLLFSTANKSIRRTNRPVVSTSRHETEDGRFRFSAGARQPSLAADECFEPEKR